MTRGAIALLFSASLDGKGLATCAHPRRGFERVEVPGDFERRHRDEADDSVHLPDAVWADLQKLMD